MGRGELRHRFELGKRNYPHKIVFAPDGKTLGVVDAGALMKFDLDTDRLLAHYDHAAWSHDANRSYGDLLFSPEGQWLFRENYEGRVYDAQTGAIVKDYGERWPNRHFSAHGGSVAVLEKDGVKTFDVLTGKEIGRFASQLKHQPFNRNAMSFSADGTHSTYWLASGEWVLHNGVAGKQCVLPQDWDNMSAEDCWSLDNRYYAGSFSKPAGVLIDELRKRLFGGRRAIHVFDTTTGREVGRPIYGGDRCCFAPDGKTLAVPDRHKRLALWDWPPPSRWPLTLMVAPLAMLLSYGIGAWWGRSRRAKLPVESS